MTSVKSISFYIFWAISAVLVATILILVLMWVQSMTATAEKDNSSSSNDLEASEPKFKDLVLYENEISQKYESLTELKDAPLPGGKSWPNLQAILEKQLGEVAATDANYIQSMYVTAWMCLWEEEALNSYQNGEEILFHKALLELRQLYNLPNFDKYMIDPNKTWEKTVLDPAHQNGSIEPLTHEVDECADYLN